MDEHSKITPIGITNYRSMNQRFGIKDSDRLGHIYVIGKTGGFAEGMPDDYYLLRACKMISIFNVCTRDIQPYAKLFLTYNKSEMSQLRELWNYIITNSTIIEIILAFIGALGVIISGMYVVINGIIKYHKKEKKKKEVDLDVSIAIAPGGHRSAFLLF